MNRGISKKKDTTLGIFAIVIVVAAIIGAVYAACCHIIPTGYTGIKTHYGQIRQEKLEPGTLIFTAPFSEKLALVSNKQTDLLAKDRVWGETNDATPVYAEGILITYQIPEDASVWIYTNIENYKTNLITDTIVASAAKSAMVELSPKDVTNRAKIEPLIQQKLIESLDDKYGEGKVLIKKVSVQQMDFEDAYNVAIQKKSIAAQEAAQAEIENKAAIAKAEADKEIAIKNAEAAQEVAIKQAETSREVAKKQAETDAQTLKITSEAQAEAALIAAQAEAEANEKINASLTEQLIELKKIEKWDGKLPTVSTSDATLMIDMEAK